MTDIFPAVTPHHGARKPSMIIIHGTEVDDVKSRLILSGQTSHQGSAHYYIDDKGEVVQYLDETARAWHAGKSHWAGFSDVNSLSVGIELLALSNNRRFNEPDTFYTEPQIAALVTLCKQISEKFNIPAHHILGHQDIDSGRPYEPVPTEMIEALAEEKPLAMQKKYDPGPFFPWKTLADHGVGVWHGLEKPAQDTVIEDSRMIEAFAQMASLYGYDTRPAPTGRDLKDVIVAFQTHFLPWNICGLVTEQTIRALDILLDKKFKA